MKLAVILFILAGLAEIGGGYLVWLALRSGYPMYIGVLGGIVLAVYGVVMTWQAFPTFGRIYAAYGGVFIVMSVLWGWVVDGQKPDGYDWLGSAICLIGAAIILFAPRH